MHRQHDYEFTESENRVIEKTATWALALAIMMFVSAAMALINGLQGIISAGIDVALGISFLNGSKAFKAVINTQGNDVAHMIQALEKIGNAFTIRIAVVLVAVVLGVLGGAAIMAMLPRY